MPTIRLLAGIWPSRKRWNRAGSNLRTARSPVPPKITRSNGSTVWEEAVTKHLDTMPDGGQRPDGTSRPGFVDGTSEIPDHPDVCIRIHAGDRAGRPLGGTPR